MILEWHFHTLKINAYFCWIFKCLVFLSKVNNKPTSPKYITTYSLFNKELIKLKYSLLPDN